MRPAELEPAFDEDVITDVFSDEEITVELLPLAVDEEPPEPERDETVNGGAMYTVEVSLR